MCIYATRARRIRDTWCCRHSFVPFAWIAQIAAAKWNLHNNMSQTLVLIFRLFGLPSICDEYHWISELSRRPCAMPCAVYRTGVLKRLCAIIIQINASRYWFWDQKSSTLNQKWWWPTLICTVWFVDMFPLVNLNSVFYFCAHHSSFVWSFAIRALFGTASICHLF